MVKILTIFLVGAVLFVLLLRIFFVQCIGKESESPLPTKMSSPGRMIVKSITGNGVPASPSVAGSASGAVTAVCGNGANVGRYEARNDALGSIMRSRSLTKEDAAALMAYLASTNDAMRVERVAALKNDVMNLLRNQEPPVAGLAETLPVLRKALSSPRRDAVLDIVCIGSVGLLGDCSDISRLSHFIKCNSRRASAAQAAIRRINERSGVK